MKRAWQHSFYDNHSGKHVQSMNKLMIQIVKIIVKLLFNESIFHNYVGYLQDDALVVIGFTQQS